MVVAIKHRAHTKNKQTVTYHEKLLQILPACNVIQDRHKVSQLIMGGLCDFPERMFRNNDLWDPWRLPATLKRLAEILFVLPLSHRVQLRKTLDGIAVAVQPVKEMRGVRPNEEHKHPKECNVTKERYQVVLNHVEQEPDNCCPCEDPCRQVLVPPQQDVRNCKIPNEFSDHAATGSEFRHQHLECCRMPIHENFSEILITSTRLLVALNLSVHRVAYELMTICVYEIALSAVRHRLKNCSRHEEAWLQNSEKFLWRLVVIRLVTKALVLISCQVLGENKGAWHEKARIALCRGDRGQLCAPGNVCFSRRFSNSSGIPTYSLEDTYSQQQKKKHLGLVCCCACSVVQYLCHRTNCFTQHRSVILWQKGKIILFYLIAE